MPETIPNDVSKQSNDSIIATIKEEFANTNTKIETVQITLDEKIIGIKNDVAAHSERLKKLESYAATDTGRIDSLSIQLEILKQDRLRNNIRLTGLPPQAFNSTIDTVMRIVDLLKIQLLPSDFVAYSDRNKSSILVQFDNHAHKRYFMDSMRKKSELLVEEILDVHSNSKVYCNDQLTPYFASLFQKAWQAKKDKLIHSASSLGGRIKIKKTENSNFINVHSEMQLSDVIANTESLEMSHHSISESPSSVQVNETNGFDSQNRPPQTVTRDRNAFHSSSFTVNEREQDKRGPAQSALSQKTRNNNRNQQWQRMHRKQNNQHEQPRYGHRYQQQDRRRDIDLSPRHYNRSKPSSFEQQPSRKHNNRNYSYRSTDERY